MSLKIAVAGGCGYIGSIVTQTLLEAGHHVVVIDKLFFGNQLPEEISRQERLTLLEIDIRDTQVDDLSGCDGLIDLAAIANDPACDLKQELTYSINVHGRIHLAETAKRAGVNRYIIASSCALYGSNTEENLNEETPPRPITLYSYTCSLLEAKITSMHCDRFVTTIIRCGTVFGISPRMRFDLVVNQMTLNSVRYKEITVTGSGDQWRPHIHVSDIASALLLIIQAPPKIVGAEIFNLAWKNCRIIDVAQIIADANPGTKVTFHPSGTPDRRSYHVDASKIRNELGFQAHRSIQGAATAMQKAIHSGELTDDPACYTARRYAELISTLSI